MGLSYLSKKRWNPTNFKNVKEVYEAEQEDEGKKRRIEDHKKKLREEAQIEEIRRIQA